MRRWYPAGILLAGALVTVLSLRGAPALLPAGLLILIVGAYSVRFARRRPATPDPGAAAPVGFTIAPRGYARPHVDDLVRRGEEAVAADPTTRAAVRAEAAAPYLPLALRGYRVQEVDAYLADLVRRLEDPPGR